MDYGLRMMLGGGFYFWLIPLAIVLIVIYSGYKAFWSREKSLNKERDGQSSIETLKVRFAKGEISEEEYERMKRMLIED
ncbi:SHOCT domain-containing protein [Bacillaceae bacterium S4-13-58]